MAKAINIEKCFEKFNDTFSPKIDRVVRDIAPYMTAQTGSKAIGLLHSPPGNYLFFLSFFNFRLSFELSLAFFWCSLLPLSLLPLSPISVSPCLKTTCIS